MANKRNNTADAAASRWQGQLEGMAGKLLYGWTLDRLNPDARVVVQICLNGEAVGHAFADVARHDISALLAPATDVCHGFVFDTGMLAAQGSFTAMVANTAVLLAGPVVQMGSAGSAPRTAPSLVFNEGGLRLCGYVLDAQNPARGVRVRAFLGAQQLAEAVADRDLPQLRGIGAGAHGFVLDLPLTLADGATHSVLVVDEAGFPLGGSPLTVCCYASGAQVLLPPAQQAPLLHSLLQSYQDYLPRSVGWNHYAAWAQQFAASVPPQAGALVPVALLVVQTAGAAGQPGPSLQQQRGVDCLLFPANSTSVNQPQHKAGQGKAGANRAAKSASLAETEAPVAPSPSTFSSLFAAQLQAALASRAEWLACVREGDSLPAHALACALAGARHHEAEIIYTDSEAGQGRQLRPWLKPAWNADYALATDYSLELMLLNTASIRRWLQTHACPDHAAALAWGMLAEVWPRAARAIVHVPHVLYRFVSPLSPAERAQRLQAAQAALALLQPQARLVPLEIDAGPDCSARRLQRPLPPAVAPAAAAIAGGAQACAGVRVSLIIPTRDQPQLLERCINSLLQYTDWPNLEIIIADNDSVEAKTHTLFRKLARQGIKVVPVPGPFNFARINNLAVAACSGEVIGLINNDIEALHPGWLQEMLSHLLQDGVGAVGAKLLWPNYMVQHGGIVLGSNHVAGHYGNLWHDTDAGDHARNQVVLQVSGVTAACLLMRKADYLAQGGMDEVAFPVAFNDVDLCLRLRAQGKSIIWTPFARLLHAESASRGKEDTPQKRARARREIEQLQQRWGTVLLHDPAYHPGLNLDSQAQAFSGLALPPRKREPRLAGLIFEEGDHAGNN